MSGSARDRAVSIILAMHAAGYKACRHTAERYGVPHASFYRARTDLRKSGRWHEPRGAKPPPPGWGVGVATQDPELLTGRAAVTAPEPEPAVESTPAPRSKRKAPKPAPKPRQRKAPVPAEPAPPPPPTPEVVYVTDAAPAWAQPGAPSPVAVDVTQTRGRSLFEALRYQLAPRVAADAACVAYSELVTADAASKARMRQARADGIAALMRGMFDIAEGRDIAQAVTVPDEVDENGNPLSLRTVRSAAPATIRDRLKATEMIINILQVQHDMGVHLDPAFVDAAATVSPVDALIRDTAADPLFPDVADVDLMDFEG